MSTKIGPFEILSELSKSPTAVVYKANDPESGQTIALKAIQLSVFGDSAAAVEQALLAEAEGSKVLNSANITPVSGASVLDGQFCAGMEYVQGNSIATMLARKEGFSIWDLLDIGRQLSSGLEHARANNIVHYSLEPAKIMCGWDGTVRILGYGVSSVGNFVQQVPGTVPSILYYMSPEQVLGDACDARSNLFSLGAMLYEMVTERKAFDGEDVASLRQSILDSAPAAPVAVNPKVHPVLSGLIMKALSKDPAERYQTGRELLDDLEKCKETKTAKKTEAPKATTAAPKPNPAAQAKFVTSATARAAAPAPSSPAPSLPTQSPAPSAASSAVASPASPAVSVEAKAKLAKPASRLAAPKAAAAAAGIGGESISAAPEASSVIGSSDAAAATFDSSEAPSAAMSSTSYEPEIEVFETPAADDGPKIAVDPMMAEGGGAKSSGSVSFSEMTELPPLKEVYIPPPPPPAPLASAQSAAPATVYQGGGRKTRDEKPKVQPREVAQKAIKEIKGVPPQLMGYAIGGAIALILVIGIGVWYYVHSLNSDDDAGAERAAAVTQAPAQPVATPSAAQPQPVPDPAASQPVAVDPAASSEEPETSEPRATANSRSRKTKTKAAPAAVIPGGLAVDSAPQGAQVQVDGQTDPSWVTPFALSNLQPGSHSITTSKAGYSTDTRTVNVVSANRASATIRLAQLMATLIVKSDPSGANIYVDGRDVGTKTPAQVSVDKGQHVVLVRMPGYIDETMSLQFVLGQTFNFSPTLRSLGNTENIKTVGKFKLFGGKGAQAGQGMVSIHTTPKGGQVAVNQHMLDKNSPVDVMLDPGNYVIDITLSGYAPVHKVIAVDKGGKVAVDENMQPQ